MGAGEKLQGGGVPGIEVEATSANKENSKLAFTQASHIVAGGGGGVSLVLRWKQHPQTKRIQNWHLPKQAK